MGHPLIKFLQIRSARKFSEGKKTLFAFPNLILHVGRFGSPVSKISRFLTFGARSY